MAAVIYMISVYPVRSKEKLVASVDFVEMPFQVLLGPITLRVETRIFICKRMPAYSAKIGGDFFLAIEILICLKVSVQVEIVAIICVSTIGVKVLADYRRVRQRQREHTQSPKPRSPSALQPVQKKKDHQQYDFHKVERGKRKEHLNLPKLLEDLDKNR